MSKAENTAKILFSILALTFSSNALAWGRQGHEIVARIAESRLGPKAAAMVKGLLGEGESLAQIANCADGIRDRKSAFKCGPLSLAPNPATSGWHVFEIPLAASPDIKTARSFCKDCILTGIEKNLETLKDPAAALADRRLALAYLVHLVGDLHQPLHCAADNLAAKPRARFGNTKKIVYEGVTLNLHHFWDHLLRSDAEANAIDVVSLARSIGGGSPPGDGDELRGDFVAAAALESFRMSQKEIYPDLARWTGPLDSKYADRWLPRIRERLRVAGVRLAALLDRAAANSSGER